MIHGLSHLLYTQPQTSFRSDAKCSSLNIPAFVCQWSEILKSSNCKSWATSECYLTDIPGNSLHTPSISCPFLLLVVRFQSWSCNGFNFHSHVPVLTDYLRWKRQSKGSRNSGKQLGTTKDAYCQMPDLSPSASLSPTSFCTFESSWALYTPCPHPVSKSLCRPGSFFFVADIIVLGFSLLPYIFLCKSEKMFCHLQLSCQLKLAGVCTLGQESASFTGC